MYSGVIWPEWATRTIATILVIDNLASVFHVVVGFFACVMGCGRRVFLVFLGYQFFTTLAKTLFIPGYQLSMWGTDFVGDTLEYVIGVGFAYIFSLNDRLAGRPEVRRVCTWKSIALMLVIVMVFWAIGFALALQGRGGL